MRLSLALAPASAPTGARPEPPSPLDPPLKVNQSSSVPMPPIIDEFTHLPISRQHKHQLRMRRDKRCPECGEPAAQGASRCIWHLVEAMPGMPGYPCEIINPGRCPSRSRSPATDHSQSRCGD